VTEFQAATNGRQQTFGAWLDNADVNAPGEAWMSISTTYWRSFVAAGGGCAVDWGVGGRAVTETSGRLSFTGGVTINVAGPAAHTPRVP
jgi:hypothetical protein